MGEVWSQISVSERSFAIARLRLSASAALIATGAAGFTFLRMRLVSSVSSLPLMRTLA